MPVVPYTVIYQLCAKTPSKASVRHAEAFERACDCEVHHIIDYAIQTKSQLSQNMYLLRDHAKLL